MALSCAAAFVALLLAAQPPVPRDAPSPGPRSASITGRVVDDAGAPVSQALVTVVGIQPGGARTTFSGEDGAFEFSRLPAVRVLVMASAPGYVDGEHARDGTATRIDLQNGRSVEAHVIMTRTAVITGMVTDDQGVPMRDARVSIWRTRADGRFGAGRVNVTATDGAGIYRAWGLPPGEYAVATSSASDGVAIPPGGLRVTVGAGEERRGADIRYAAPPRAIGRIDGSALMRDGRPVRFLRLELFRPGDRTTIYLQPVVDPDGSFIVRNVPDGALVLAASTDGHWAFAEVQVAGGARVSVPPLTLRPGVTITGRIVPGGTDPPIVNLARVYVGLVPLEMPEQIMNSAATSRTNPDGAFTIGNVPPGRYTIRVRGPAAGSPWTVQSAVVAGADALEKPFEVRQAAIAGVIITLVSRPER